MTDCDKLNSVFLNDISLHLFKEIIKEVKKKSDIPFRPSLAEATCSLEFQKMIMNYWQEIPKKRPSFHRIISDLDNLFENV